MILLALALLGTGYIVVLGRTGWLDKDPVRDWQLQNTPPPPIFQAYYNDRLTEDYAYLRALVECGVDVDEHNEHGETLLMHLMFSHDPYELQPAVVEYLLKSGANPNAAWNGCSVLHCAATEQRVEYIRMLIEHGAEVDARDRVGDTPLIGFIRLYYSPNSTIYCDPSVFEDGRPGVAAVLVDAGADITLKNKRGKTAYDYVSDRPWAGFLSPVKLSKP